MLGALLGVGTTQSVTVSRWWCVSEGRVSLLMCCVSGQFPDLDAPRDLQATELTDESITLEWRNSLAKVDNYRIKYGPLSGGDHGELIFPSGPRDTSQAKITGENP